MSYVRACSHLPAAAGLRRLAGCGSSGPGPFTFHHSVLIRSPEIWRLCNPQSSSRSFTSSFRRTQDLILQDETARETNKRDQQMHEEEVETGIQEATKQQIKRPWQREGADKPPVDRDHRNMNKTMTKGSSRRIQRQLETTDEANCNLLLLL